MQAFLEFVARNLVDYPDEVAVGVRPGPGKTAYELRVHRSDVGKLVGKNGQTIEAIRALVAAAGAKNGHRVQVEIVEDPSVAVPATGNLNALSEKASETRMPGQEGEQGAEKDGI